MTESSRTIFCASCDVPVKIRIDGEREIAFCPSCGIHDTAENVAAEAMQSLMDKLARNAFGPSRTIGGGPLKVTFRSPQERYFRFIVHEEAQ